MIPKTIHYCWLSDTPFPPLVNFCMQTWRDHLPDYKFVLWNKEKTGEIMQISWVKEAYENKKYAFAADYIRLYALYTEGGIYLDTDVQIFKSLSPLLVSSSFMGHETDGDLEAAIIGAQAGTEWIAQCLEYYNGKHFCKPDSSLETKPLPIIIEETLKKNYQIPANFQKIQIIHNAGLTLYPADFLSPLNEHTKKIKITKNTYTVHHFDGNWVDKTFVFYVKKILHRIIISLLGNKRHNQIIQKIRNKNL